MSDTPDPSDRTAWSVDRREVLRYLGASGAVLSGVAVGTGGAAADSDSIVEGPVENTFEAATVDPADLPEPNRREELIDFGGGSAEEETVPIERPESDGDTAGSKGDPVARGGGDLGVGTNYDGYGTRDTVRGTDFDDDGEITEDEVFFVVPADSQIATGSDAHVSTINSEVGVFDKETGERLVDARLEDWFANVLREPTEGFFEDYFVFDPRARYDADADRFYVACVEYNIAENRGDYLLSVSTTSDPTDPWTNYRVTPLRSDGLVDYPELGFDGNAVYLTQNFFDFTDDFEFVEYGGPTLAVLPKDELLAGEDVTAKQYEDLRNPDGSKAFTVQPASMPGYDSSTGDGFYFVNSRFFEGQTLTLWELTDPTGDPTVTNATLTVEPYNNSPASPQPDTEEKIDTGDTRLLNVAWDPTDGNLWTTHTVDGRSVRWYELDPQEPDVVQTGLFKREGLSTFFPAVETNGDSTLFAYNVASGKGGESESAYVRPEVTGRREGFEAGELEDFAVVTEGESEYDYVNEGEGDPGSQTLRWGDYNGISIDPEDGSYWVCSQYASEPDTQQTYRTRIANVDFE